MGKLPKLFLLSLLLWAIVCEDNLIDFAADVPAPVIENSHRELETIQKLTGDKYIKYLDGIGFEISSSISVTRNQVDESNLYNEAAYLPSANQQANCKVYPTDISFRGFSFLSETHAPLDVALLSKKQVKADQELIKGYAAFEHNIIEEFDIVSHPTSSQIPTVQKVSTMRIIPEKGTEEENSPEAHKPKLLVVQDTLYVFNKFNAYVYTGGKGEDKFTRLTGFNAPSDSTDRMVAVGKIDETRLYVVSNTRIDIYQVSQSNKDKLYLFKSYDDLKMGTFTPIAVHYDSNSRTFFLTTFGYVYTVQVGDIDPEPTIRILKTNGTCNFVDMHRSALHLSCRYNSISYVAEIYLWSQDDFKINRYYSDMEIYETSVVRKIGDGIMVLVGDDQIRIQNYAVNKQVIKDINKHQPYFHFQFSKGKDLIEIAEMRNNRNFYFLGLYDDKIQLMNIYQEPPQLYCESSPEEKDGVEYNVLIQFNTTSCTINENEPESVHHLMSLCQVSVPIKITTAPNLEIKVAGSTHGLAIAMIVVAALIAVVAGVWSFKRWRGLDEKMEALTHQLEKLRKRGKKNPAQI